MRSETFFIPVMPRSTNATYAGTHWAKRKQEADYVHNEVLKSLDRSPEMLTPFLNPVEICLTPRLGKGVRARDVSNYSHSYKLIEDGLIHAGILLGDESDKVVSMSIKRPMIDRKRETGFWVTVTEYEVTGV